MEILRAFFVAPACLLCKQPSEEIVCRYCLEDTEISTFSAPGENLLEMPSVMSNRMTPDFHALHAIGWHESILAQLVNQLKFGRQHLAAKALAYLFYTFVLNRLSQVEDLPDVFIPVPISTIRLMTRGFNQAQLIAEYLSLYHPINIVQPVTKTRHTKQQSRMQRHERFANMQNAFTLKHNLNAKHICIIDDVLTTGATVNQISELILDRYPSAKISVWCMSVAKFD